MRVRNHGKYTKMSMTNPRAIARCDYSGMMVRQMDLAKQMQYSGNGPKWTGLLVNPKFLTKPNAQELMPRIEIDPMPILEARPDNEIGVITPSLYERDVSGSADVTLSATQFQNNTLRFTGELTGDITIFVPAIFNEFYLENLTTGAFTLSMQILNNTSPDVVIPAGISLILNDSFVLKFIYTN